MYRIVGTVTTSLAQTLVRLPSALIVFLSFFLAILVGASLLSLPISTTTTITFTDALFTATSATCVTGLSVVDTGTRFTSFGQLVLLILMQIGGVGVMTCSVAMFHLLGRSICHRDKLVLRDVFGVSELGGITSLIRLIFATALFFELIGALFLWFLLDIPDPTARMWSALFHAVSAFCNAGFSLFPDNLMGYQSDLLVNLIIATLIVLGGLGFPTIFELTGIYRDRRHKRTRLSLQSKLICITTVILIVLGSILIFTLEADALLRSFSLHDALLISFFQSVTTRTAGFNTIDLATFSEPTLLVMMILMLIGGAPGSCAGGIKVTTGAVLFGFVFSRLRGFRKATLFHRSITDKTLAQSMSLVAISFFLINSSLFILLVANSSHGTSSLFMPLLFESISAFATVGLSLGITPTLGDFDKFVLITLMFLGRVGVFTLSYVVLGMREERRYVYAEEAIMIG